MLYTPHLLNLFIKKSILAYQARAMARNIHPHMGDPNTTFKQVLGLGFV